MPLDLGTRYMPDWPGVPPHISTSDLPIWNRFREKYGKNFLGFYYDVGLGVGEAGLPEISEPVARAWDRLTKLRLDVVGDTPSEWWLIELRPNAGPGAIGAIETYSSLWEEDPPNKKPFIKVIVTDRMSADILSVAMKNGIRVILV